MNTKERELSPRRSSLPASSFRIYYYPPPWLIVPHSNLSFVHSSSTTREYHKGRRGELAGDPGREGERKVAASGALTPLRTIGGGRKCGSGSAIHQLDYKLDKQFEVDWKPEMRHNSYISIR